MDATIRRADVGDAKVVARVVRGSFRDVAARFDLTPESAPTHPSNCRSAWILSDLARGVSYYVLCQGGSVVGCMAVELASPSVAYLERLGVLPEERGRGFGSELVRHALREARSAGARVVSVGVIAEDTELVSWYERLGFRKAGSRRFSHLPFRVRYLEHAVS